MANRDAAADQLTQYGAEKKIATTAGGAPLITPERSLTTGLYGPMVVHDIQFVEEVAHFVRERIPERVLHAKGAGAFGYFEVTNNYIAQFTSAKVFSDVGKKTPVVVRFSTTVGESGSAEAARDPKGMSVKFQTEEGILDLVGNHQPVFFLRDPVLFPSLVRAAKRNPSSHLADMNAFWDFMSLRPETTYMLMHIHSDRGIPKGWRNMESYPANVYKLVNAINDDYVYAKFWFKCGQKNPEYLSDVKASNVGPDFYKQDLYEAIEKGNYPTWTLMVQIMHPNAARAIIQHPKRPFDPFDVTKVWPKELPWTEVGRIRLVKNPNNFFAEIEQLAVSPANLVPGLEPSAYDLIFQGRIFVYADAQRYRLGTNFQQLGANRPLSVVSNYQRDGPQTFFHQGDDPIYYPNSSQRLLAPPGMFRSVFRKGEDRLFDGFLRKTDDDDFFQPRSFYEDMEENRRNILAQNLAAALRMIKPAIQKKVLDNFAKVSRELFMKIKLNLK